MAPKLQVVVAFDFTPSSQHALARAIDTASRAPEHVLHVVSILDTRGTLLSGSSEHTYESAEAIHQHVMERVAAGFSGRSAAAEVEVYVHARIGKPATEILAVAAEVGADLIFIGSHGVSGLERMLLGSVSERVVREARCPVMVVRARSYPHVERLHVVEHEHPRAPFHPPHRYVYSDQHGLTRSNDWPLGGGG